MKLRNAECGMRIGDRSSAIKNWLLAIGYWLSAVGRTAAPLQSAIRNPQSAIFLFTALSLLAHSASAESILLEHAIVHTASGTVITNGSVLMDNGKITGVLDTSH